MSQEQPQKPSESGNQLDQQQDPIKYGDVFPVSGELASKPIAPRDAATMEDAENRVFGQTQVGGPAAIMQAAATINEMAGVVNQTDATDVVQKEGINVTGTDIRGGRIITESIGGQVIGQFVQPASTPGEAGQTGITIGQALEASARSAGSKPVEYSDAAAIQAAENRATGTTLITPGGPAATAQAAAAYNQAIQRDEDKVKIGDVLTGVTARLPVDKAVTREDAEGVMTAELHYDPNFTGHPGGVADALAAAARANERTTNAS